MGMLENAKAYLLEAWNNRDYDTLVRIMDPEYHPDWMLMDEKGPDLTMREIKYITSAIPDYKYEIIDHAISDNKVWIWYRTSGTHEGNFFGFEPTNKSFTYEGASVFIFNDTEQITDRKGFYCFEDIFRELGLMPDYWELAGYFKNYKRK
jgi:predicted ester cyclase